MKKLGLLSAVLAGFVLAACGGDVTGPAPLIGVPDALFSKGVANPGTEVTVEASFTAAGGTIIRESGPGNTGGTCGPGGAWTPPAGPTLPNPPHAQCLTVVDGVEINLTFDEIANYVLPKSGNLHLNFAAHCTLVWNEATEEYECALSERSIHFANNLTRTQGQGLLYATDEDDNAWVLDLSQIYSLDTPTGLDPDIRRFEGLVACQVDSDPLICADNGVMTWPYEP